MLIYLSQLLFQILLGYTRPYETFSKNVLAMINEILCSSYLLMYLIASDFNNDPMTRSGAGTGLLGIIFIYVVLNLTYFVVAVVK
jgi:hypothetical protein